MRDRFEARLGDQFRRNPQEAEHDNLRAALEWSLQGGQAASGLQLIGPIWRFWFVRGYFTEGCRWLGALLRADGDASVLPPGRATTHMRTRFS
jgi:predicted ATPase